MSFESPSVHSSMTSFLGHQKAFTVLTRQFILMGPYAALRSASILASAPVYPLHAWASQEVV